MDALRNTPLQRVRGGSNSGYIFDQAAKKRRKKSRKDKRKRSRNRSDSRGSSHADGIYGEGEELLPYKDHVHTTRVAYEDIPPEILRAGYLRKQGGRIKTWSKRWFALSRDGFSFHKKEGADAIFNIILSEILKVTDVPLSGRSRRFRRRSSVDVSGDDDLVEKHDVSLRRFEVVTNLRTYRLEVSKDAPSHTRVQWMVAIATVANCELDICHQTIYEVMADLAVPDDQPRFGAQMPTYIAPTHVCKMIVKRKIRLDSVEGIGLLIQLLPRLTGPVRGSELVMLANKTCFSTFILWLLFRVLTTKADPDDDRHEHRIPREVDITARQVLHILTTLPYDNVGEDHVTSERRTSSVLQTRQARAGSSAGYHRAVPMTMMETVAEESGRSSRSSLFPTSQNFVEVPTSSTLSVPGQEEVSVQIQSDLSWRAEFARILFPHCVDRDRVVLILWFCLDEGVFTEDEFRAVWQKCDLGDLLLPGDVASAAAISAGTSPVNVAERIKHASVAMPAFVMADLLHLTADTSGSVSLGELEILRGNWAALTNNGFRFVVVGVKSIASYNEVRHIMYVMLPSDAWVERHQRQRRSSSFSSVDVDGFNADPVNVDLAEDGSGTNPGSSSKDSGGGIGTGGDGPDGDGDADAEADADDDDDDDDDDVDSTGGFRPPPRPAVVRKPPPGIRVPIVDGPSMLGTSLPSHLSVPTIQHASSLPSIPVESIGIDINVVAPTPKAAPTPKISSSPHERVSPFFPAHVVGRPERSESLGNILGDSFPSLAAPSDAISDLASDASDVRSVDVGVQRASRSLFNEVNEVDGHVFFVGMMTQGALTCRGRSMVDPSDGWTPGALDIADLEGHIKLLYDAGSGRRPVMHLIRLGPDEVVCREVLEPLARHHLADDPAAWREAEQALGRFYVPTIEEEDGGAEDGLPGGSLQVDVLPADEDLDNAKVV